MGKKKINIILILIVLGLWGTVGYKIINKQFSNNKTISKKQDQIDNIAINQINKDTFVLEKLSHDPFLTKEYQTTILSLKEITTDRIPLKKAIYHAPIKTNSSVKWPLLKYYGYILSKERNNEVVLLKIDSKLYKLKLNTPLNGLIIKKKYKDSIEVYFNSETKIIRLKSTD
ncbi:hypothetical protein [[Flexibacter] sp. ATCC 35103]|uniref:hypothetical protein n=1 Tax=[Flexibacter] sp. ATCC 35103 TaxID=1937528 RepID=UPI0009D28C16|nr:hypothetical protein [[Flexibacter] sp. ATCC 35103]OMQ11322.1 hypothetical protein BXU01_13460 [[Flexibacter] sp. ATCC 35103]